MGIRNLADENDTEHIHVLVRRSAYREALERTMADLGAELGRYCMARLGSQSQVDIAMQEIFRAYYDALPTLEHAPIRPCLYQLAHRTCERHWNALDDEERARALALRQSDDKRLPPDADAARQQARALRRSLSQVRPLERNTVLLRCSVGLGYVEIGSVLGISEAEARKRFGRGLLKLRQLQQDSASEAEA